MKRFIKFLSTGVIVSAILLLLAQPISVMAGRGALNKSANSSRKVIKNEIHIKINNSYAISVKKNIFTGEPTDQVSKLNDILASAKRTKVESIITSSPANGAQLRIKRAINGYYKVVLARDADVATLTAQLKELSIVETAYGAPNITPPPSADYTSFQNYRNAAPTGVNAGKTSAWPGADGSNVKIVDLEYAWNFDHEDLSKAKTALVPNGTPNFAPFSRAFDNDNAKQHGTAVLGEMVADSNGYGVTGITPGANLELINIYNQERGYDLFTSLYIAALTTKPGDVILIEQQAWGPTPVALDYVPVEWVPEYYDIIKSLTDMGRIVIEPAGDGNQNLDDAAYYGNTFPSNKPDSGAIIVGAGESCDGSSNARGRMADSTYGSRINLQGPGTCVVTTGYGNLTGDTINNFYTNSFNSTSSAAPVVASAAASLSSAFKVLNNGATLSSQQIRDILYKTGTPQNTSTGTLQGNIGRLPNLARALRFADTTAPSTPANFRVSLNGQQKPLLQWEPSTDNYKIRYYQIYRNSSFYKKVYSTEFTDTNVWPGVTYKYKVRAVDYMGNKSAFTPYQTVAVR